MFLTCQAGGLCEEKLISSRQRWQSPQADPPLLTSLRANSIHDRARLVHYLRQDCAVAVTLRPILAVSYKIGDSLAVGLRTGGSCSLCKRREMSSSLSVQACWQRWNSALYSYIFAYLVPDFCHKGYSFIWCSHFWAVSGCGPFLCWDFCCFCLPIGALSLKIAQPLSFRLYLLFPSGAPVPSLELLFQFLLTLNLLFVYFSTYIYPAA